ncbi:hypothetical protein VNO77_17796 [Canavalia gladiata]|uniref:Uncharacterized protein n=1 Tax=Canavalia gladiata TaxID=3824 RepID=A0AAN9QJ21_CANGL
MTLWSLVVVGGYHIRSNEASYHQNKGSGRDEGTGRNDVVCLGDFNSIRDPDERKEGVKGMLLNATKKDLHKLMEIKALTSMINSQVLPHRFSTVRGHLTLFTVMLSSLPFTYSYSEEDQNTSSPNSQEEQLLDALMDLIGNPNIINGMLDEWMVTRVWEGYWNGLSMGEGRERGRKREKGTNPRAEN